MKVVKKQSQPKPPVKKSAGSEPANTIKKYAGAVEKNYQSTMNRARNSEGSDAAIERELYKGGFKRDALNPAPFSMAEKRQAYDAINAKKMKKTISPKPPYKGK